MSTDELKYLSDRIATTVKVRIGRSRPRTPLLQDATWLIPALLANIFRDWMPFRVTRADFEIEFSRFKTLEGSSVSFGDLDQIHWVRTINCSLRHLEKYFSKYVFKSWRVILQPAAYCCRSEDTATAKHQ